MKRRKTKAFSRRKTPFENQGERSFEPEGRVRAAQRLYRLVTEGAGDRRKRRWRTYSTPERVDHGGSKTAVREWVGSGLWRKGSLKWC
jgi:hypothetical protein